MKTILLSAIGGDLAQSVAMVLRESHPTCRILGTDMSDHHGGALWVDDHFQVPAATQADYWDKLQEIIRKESVDVFIPLSEIELRTCLPHLEESQDLRFITPGAHVLQTGLDKFETIRELKRLGLPTPWTIAQNQGRPLSFPCILKNRRGSGSQRVFLVQTMEEAIALSSQMPDGIFQEWLGPDDQEITCAVYRTRDHRTAVCQMRRQLSSGITVWAEIIADNSIQDLCERIANGLDLDGSMNVQLRLTREGPRVFEINPRFSSTVLMRHRVGFSDVAWSIDELDGKSIVFPKIATGQVIVRTHGAAVLAPAQTVTR